MALIKMGAAVAQISGSIGGTTFARNRGGAYMRNRTSPLNPQSVRQSAVRATLATLSNRWSTVLTPTQREAWETYAANVPVQNRLGEERFLSGISMYIAGNSLLSDAGATLADDGPTIFTKGPSLTPTITVDAAADTFDITAIPGSDGANDPFYLLVQQGVPQNGGVNFFKAPFRKVHSTHVNATPFVAEADLPLVFPLTSGQAQFMRSAIVTDDGRVGSSIVQRFLAT